MNRELDNSVLISLPRFFFSPLLFLSMVFYNVSNDRARTTFEKLTFERHREVIKKEKKTGIYLSNENWDIIRYQRMSSIIPPPYLSCSSSNVSDCSSKRERKLEKEKRVHNSTGRKHYRNVTDNRIFLRGRRISRKISGLIKSHDEPSRVTRRVVRGERASFRL